MRALVASCVFPPEPVISAKTSSDIAHFLDSVGYETVVICPKPTRNYDSTSTKYSDRVRTLRLFSVASKRSTFLSRFIENISFGLSSFFHILFARKKYDVIYSNVWPVFATGLVLLAAKIRRSKIILSVQDLYPESLVQQSRLTPKSLIYKLLFKLDRLISCSADHVIVISEKFYQAYSIKRSVSPRSLTIIPNWVDSSAIRRFDKSCAREKLKELIEKQFWEDDCFYVVYGGNIGVASGMGILPELVKNLPNKFRFLVAGDGVLLEEIRKDLDGCGVSERVLFFSPWPEDYTSIVLSAADLLFLPTAPGQSLASVPSKLITYMLAERPIFAIVDSESDTCREINRSGGGIVCSTYRIEELKEALAALLELSSEQLSEMGKNSREFAKTYYSFDSAKLKFSSILNSVI